MSDKNPYYSIPKALGEPTKTIEFLPVDPKLMIEMQEAHERFQRELFAILAGRRP